MSKFTEDVVINKILESCLANLNEKEIYLSEDDFKFSFASAAKENGCKNIVLEFPIRTIDLYKKSDANLAYFKKKYNNDDAKLNQLKSYIDISFEYNNSKYFVELKYKAANLDIERYGNSFELAAQGAGNIGLYNFHEDIERMECIKDTYSDAKSFCIMLTNDSYYWDKHKKDSMVEHVELYEKTKTANKLRCFRIKDTHYRDLQCRNSYKTWSRDLNHNIFKEFNGKKNGKFRVLVVEMKSSKSN